MALGSSIDYSSFLKQDEPQQNQYLTGNPSTDPNANTVWMDQTQKSPTTGINGGATPPGASQPTTTPQQGTALGAITAGNIGQYMPGGYDQNKWNDPNKHDPKYDVGRILSKYPPTPEGLRAAMAELGPMGYTQVGKDSISGNGLGTVDVGRAFSSGNGQWDWMPGDNGSNSGFIQGAQQNGGNQNQLLQWIMSLFGGGQPNNNFGNSTGGWAQPRMNINSVNRGPNMSGPIGTQYNQYGPGGSADNRTGAPGNYQIPTGPMQPFTSYLGGVQQPQLNPIDTLNQMWSGTFQPYRGPQ